MLPERLCLANNYLSVLDADKSLFSKPSNNANGRLGR